MWTSQLQVVDIYYRNFIISNGAVKLENDNWRKELEELGSEVREHMAKYGLKPLDDSALKIARQEANHQAAVHHNKRVVK